MENFRVAGNTNPNKLAGAIKERVKQNTGVALRAIGMKAVNQAVKALIITKKYLAEENIEIKLDLEFTDIEVDDKTVTAITLRVAEQ